MAADNRIVTRDVPKDAGITALIDKYNAIAAPLANRVIGSITADITRTNNAAGESALGDVIADGQLDATNDPGFGEAVVAFMNPGGIRADLTFNQISGRRGARRSHLRRNVHRPAVWQQPGYDEPDRRADRNPARAAVHRLYGQRCQSHPAGLHRLYILL